MDDTYTLNYDSSMGGTCEAFTYPSGTAAADESRKDTKMDYGELKVFSYGSLHWEAGEWVIGDTRVNDLISRLVGGYQNRLGGDLFISFKMRPVNTDSADPAFGGPFEPSEPVKR